MSRGQYSHYILLFAGRLVSDRQIDQKEYDRIEWNRTKEFAVEFAKKHGLPQTLAEAKKYFKEEVYTPIWS
jgi:hypothetical protein